MASRGKCMWQHLRAPQQWVEAGRVSWWGAVHPRPAIYCVALFITEFIPYNYRTAKSPNFYFSNALYFFFYSSVKKLISTQLDKHPKTELRWDQPLPPLHSATYNTQWLSPQLALLAPIISPISHMDTFIFIGESELQLFILKYLHLTCLN